MFMSLNRDLYILGVFHKLELGGAFMYLNYSCNFSFLITQSLPTSKAIFNSNSSTSNFLSMIEPTKNDFWLFVYLGNFILNSLKSICEHDTKPEPCFLPCDTFLLLSTYLWKCFLYNKQPRIMSYFQNKMLLSTYSCTLF